MFDQDVRIPCGGHDQEVLELNREAARTMPCAVTVTVVPGATHLFSEPGALEQVAEPARDWLVAQLTSR